MHKRQRRGPPVVDDADVQRIADVLLTAGDSIFALPDEKVAELAAKLATLSAYDTTAAWRQEFAYRVRRRVEFALMIRRKDNRQHSYVGS